MKRHVNPPGLNVPQGYTHVAEVISGRLVMVAGQVAYDEARQVVGDDHATQARQAFGNLKRALAGVGAGPEHVIKINTYVVNYEPSLLADIGAAAVEVMGFDPPPASTIVGVSALAYPALLIEIEATAVID